MGKPPDRRVGHELGGDAPVGQRSQSPLTGTLR